MWFIAQKKILLIISLLIMAGSLAIVSIVGLPLGIDFTGGALTEVVYETDVPSEGQVREVLDPLGLGTYSVRSTTDELDRAGYIIRTTDLNDQQRRTIQTELETLHESGEVTRFTSIGPVIGEELKSKAVYAIAGISLIIIIYIAFAFSGVSYPVGSWMYGGITIVALLHDVLVPAAVMALLGFFFGLEADVLFVMALLAVLGYSVNDTIVVFDRVRENLKRYREEKQVTVKDTAGFEREETVHVLLKPFSEIVGISVQQTLMRSVNTSVTTLLALTALLVFGGEVTRTFSIILIAGVIAGTYSSICFANPLLVYLAERQAGDAERVETTSANV